MTFKELRKQANLSVEYVSKKLGRKPQTIYNMKAVLDYLLFTF